MMNVIINIGICMWNPTGFPIVVGGHSPHPAIFFEPPPPRIKTDAPLWGTHPLKNEAPHLKNKPPIET